jgi:zinc transport system substrate-binding protein
VTALDREIREILGPAPGRVLLVYHDAWGSFARTYGIRQIAIEQEGHEPGPDRIAQVIEEARSLGIRSIFVEPQSSRRSAEMVASEIGAEVITLDPLARDWHDNLLRVARAVAGGFPS